MQAANKVIFNTIVTYSRAVITIFITLYSTRVIIEELGVKDFGLYSLVGGIVAMLAFFNSALTASTQRFVSVNLGKGLLNEVKTVIANSIVIHITIGVLIVFFVELIGGYFIQNKLIIPLDRISTAMIVFHFVVASTFITIISVPAEAILNAHENMLFLAILRLLEVFLNLGAAILLTYINNFDKLKVYAFLLFIILLLINLIKWGYCYYKYQETKISLSKDFSKSQIKEQSSFAGWNLFGAACGMGRGQGISIISNMFFGPVVNAAYGIADQVKVQSNFFSSTILRVMNPQIMKSEGADDRERMLRLSMMACKFGFFMLAFFAVPLIFEMSQVLEFWLGDIPPYVVNFSVLILIGSMIEQLTVGLKSAVQSVGQIKKYMVVVGGIILLNLPLTYILLYSGHKAESALIVFVFLEIIAGIVRLFYTVKLTGLKILIFLDNVVVKVIPPVLCSLLTCIIIVETLEFEYRFLLTILFSSISFIISAYFFSLTEEEKKIILKLYKKLLNRFT